MMTCKQCGNRYNEGNRLAVLGYCPACVLASNPALAEMAEQAGQLPTDAWEETAKTQAHEAARLARELASAMNALTDQTLKLDDAWYQMRETKKLLTGIVQAAADDPAFDLHKALARIRGFLGKHALKDEPRQPGA